MIPPTAPAIQETQLVKVETHVAEIDHRSLLEQNQEYLEQKLQLLLEPKKDEHLVVQKKAAAATVQQFLFSPAGESLFRQPVDRKIQNLMDQLAKKMDKDFQKQCTKHVSGDHPSKVVDALKVLFVNMGLRTTHTPDFSLFGGNVNIYWRKVTLESISSPTLAATITAAILSNSQVDSSIPKIPGSTVPPKKSYTSPPPSKLKHESNDGQRHGQVKGGKGKKDGGKGGKKKPQHDEPNYTSNDRTSTRQCRWGKSCNFKNCLFKHDGEEPYQRGSFKRLKTDPDDSSAYYDPSDSSSSSTNDKNC